MNKKELNDCLAKGLGYTLNERVGEVMALYRLKEYYDYLHMRVLDSQNESMLNKFNGNIRSTLFLIQLLHNNNCSSKYVRPSILAALGFDMLDLLKELMDRIKRQDLTPEEQEKEKEFISLAIRTSRSFRTLNTSSFNPYFDYHCDALMLSFVYTPEHLFNYTKEMIEKYSDRKPINVINDVRASYLSYVFRSGSGVRFYFNHNYPERVKMILKEVEHKYVSERE